MFDVFSIVFLIIIIVLVIIGIIKGFLSLALGLAKGAIAALLAALLCNPIGGLLAKTGIGGGISNGVNSFLVEKSEIFDMSLATEEEKDAFIKEGLSQALTEANIPGVVHEPITNVLKDKINIPVGETRTVGRVIGDSVGLYVCVIIAFVLLVIIFSILLWLLQKLIKNVNKVPVFGPTNRILGGVFGLLLALLIIGVVCYVLAIIISLPGEFPQKIAETLKLAEGQESEWSFAKLCYKYNIISWLIKLIF